MAKRGASNNRSVAWAQEVSKGYLQKLERTIAIAVASVKEARELQESEELANELAIKLVVASLDSILGETEENGDGLNDICLLVRKHFFSEARRVIGAMGFNEIEGGREAFGRWLETACG